ERERKAKKLIENTELDAGAAFQKPAKAQRDKKCSDESAYGERGPLCVEQDGEHQLIARHITPPTPPRQDGSHSAPWAYLTMRLLLRQFVQPPNDVAQEQFVLEVDLIIEVRAQAVFIRLPILRHHDDRRLQRGDHGQKQIQQNECINSKWSSRQQKRVCHYPRRKKRN